MRCSSMPTCASFPIRPRPRTSCSRRRTAGRCETARTLAGGPPHTLVVWNGREGDGPGGTRDFVQQLGLTGPAPNVRVIDPTPRAYEARQTSEGPKRLLALDGGGIRGVLTLADPGELEQYLQDSARDDLVLADYFDYIGGTSTGAIIATALAFGKPVAEVQEMYRNLGGKIFSKRLLPFRLRSIYRDGPLARELDSFFGADRTLGDPELRSLLLLLMHNTGTDSPWPLSNCTRGEVQPRGPGTSRRRPTGTSTLRSRRSSARAPRRRSSSRRRRSRSDRTGSCSRTAGSRRTTTLR